MSSYGLRDSASSAQLSSLAQQVNYHSSTENNNHINHSSSNFSIPNSYSTYNHQMMNNSVSHGSQLSANFFQSNTTGRRGKLSATGIGMGAAPPVGMGPVVGVTSGRLSKTPSTADSNSAIQPNQFVHAKSYNDINSVNAEATAWNLYNMAHSKSESMK